MSKGNTFETELLELIFNGTPIANIADDAAVSPLAQIWVSLHTADPGEGGSQTTNEATYGSYARVNVNRSSGAWIVSANEVTNDSLIQFPQCTSGSNTITHVAVGTDISGAGKLLYSGALSASLAVSTGIQPQFAPGDLTISED